MYYCTYIYLFIYYLYIYLFITYLLIYLFILFYLSIPDFSRCCSWQKRVRSWHSLCVCWHKTFFSKNTNYFSLYIVRERVRRRTKLFNMIFSGVQYTRLALDFMILYIDFGYWYNVGLCLTNNMVQHGFLLLVVCFQVKNYI